MNTEYLKLKILIVGIILLQFSNTLYSGYAGSGGEYLATFGTSARPLGMGGAFTGLADDTAAMYFNPAGLSYVNVREFSTFYAPIFPGESISFFSFAYAQPIWGYGRAGINWINLSSGDYIGRDAWGYETGVSYSESINTFLLSYGSPKYKNVLTGGANLKFLLHSIDGLSKSYFAFGLDIGGMYKPYKFLSAGLFIQNIIPPKMNLSTTSEYFPINFRLGVAGHLLKNKLNITGDLMIVEPFAMDDAGKGSAQFRYFFGAEYNVLKFISVRAGFNYKEITAGFGLNYWGFLFDYSYAYHYSSLLASNQYIRASLLVKIDELPFFQPIVPPKIPSVEHIVLGTRNKNLAKNKQMDQNINYLTLDLFDNNFYKINFLPVGLIVPEYYDFLKNVDIKKIKFIIPVQESGFTFIYDDSIKNYYNDGKDISISFYLPGTYINMHDYKTVDLKKQFVFIKEAILHFNKMFKGKINKFEIVYPEQCFIDQSMSLYSDLLKNILKFIAENKIENVYISAPGFLCLLDSDNVPADNDLKTFFNEFKRIKTIGFNFSYKNPENKNQIPVLTKVNDNLSLKLKKINSYFKDRVFTADINYDLKINKIKREYFYAIWSANVIHSLLNYGFYNLYFPIKSQAMTVEDVKTMNDLVLDLNRLYPDLKETDPERYKEIMFNLEKKLRVKTDASSDADYDIIDKNKKHPAFYTMDLFNKYVNEYVLRSDNDFVLSKNNENTHFTFIFLNNRSEKKNIDLKLLNAAKGVYKVTKVLYTGDLFSDKIDTPKVVEEYEVNIIKELKLNDSLLPTSITVLDFKMNEK